MEINNQRVNALILAAGLGTRLRPFTDLLPKCLMPIGGKPLLEIWLDRLRALEIGRVLINLHYKASDVEEFLNRSKFKDWVFSVYEENLLGTAGTLSANFPFFEGNTTLLAHGDNLCICDFNAFFQYHFHERPINTAITMMTFKTDTPKTCGIVELDQEGIVIAFHEKVVNPSGNLANAAIYLIEPEVLDWLDSEKEITDFSNQVIPKWVGKIATWENRDIMKDIGNPSSLLSSQSDLVNEPALDLDEWTVQFKNHLIHTMIKEYK